MEKQNSLGRASYVLLLAIGIPALTAFYYRFDLNADVDKVFLSISTFLFSIFTGFFISRQASRFNKVRETVTAFDGKMSSMYRSCAHLNNELQNAFGEIIKDHYNKIQSSGNWHVHFTEKSTTMKSLHNALKAYVQDDDVTKIGNQSLGAIVKGLDYCQGMRKQMVALYAERIPYEQWILILFFSTILISTVSVFPSVDFLFASLLKAAFVASIFSVLLTLYKLDKLIFSEKIMGSNSAQDVLSIINNTK